MLMGGDKPWEVLAMATPTVKWSEMMYVGKWLMLKMGKMRM
jgi:hypothetical protein